MSTTTAADLLTQADRLVRDLRAGDHPVDLAGWERFDASAYRLLHQLVGPGRTGEDRTAALSHAVLIRTLEAYPTPLRPPVGGTTYSTRHAAQLLDLTPDGVLHRIHAGQLPATFDGKAYSIAAADLDHRDDLTPADPTDPRPLVRLACTLGALTDLLTTPDQPATITLLGDDAQVATVMAHVLSLTAVTARHTIAHCPVADADRPLRVAQYAERALDAITAEPGPRSQPAADCLGRDRTWLRSLDRIASCAPPCAPTTLNERLEADLRDWAAAARDELTRTVPSTEVLRNIANQGVHLYAVTDRLLHARERGGVDDMFHLGDSELPRGDSQLSTAELDAVSTSSAALRDGAAILQRADRHWAAVTTAMPPSHEYVSTARDLFHVLRDVGQLELIGAGSGRRPAAALDAEQALIDLRIASRDLADLMHQAQPLPEVLVRSHVLFAPAKSLQPSLERLADRAKGGYVPITPAEAATLASAADAAAEASRTAADRLHLLTLPADHDFALRTRPPAIPAAAPEL